MRNQAKITNILWFLVCALGSSAWILSTAAKWGPTFDEPTYLECGLRCWETGSHKPLMRLGTMPLPVDVQTLPLYLAEKYQGRNFDTRLEMETILPWARGMNLIFWWVLLFQGWKLGWLFGGPWGARIGVFFLATEPNLTSHAALATTDIALTAFLLGFFYSYWTGFGKGWCQRIGLPSLWYSLALCSKASALPFTPIIMAGCEIWRYLETRGKTQTGEELPPQSYFKDRFPLFVKDGLKIGFLGLLLVFVFCGSDWQTERTFVEWARQLPEGAVKPWMVWLSENLKIFTNAGEGLAQQIKHNFRGHNSFILGQAFPRAIWYYFPVLLTIKETTAVLFLLGGLVFLARKHLWNPLILVAFLMFLFSFNCRVQIGIRFLFPLVSLGILGLGVSFAMAFKTNPGKQGLLKIVLVIPMILALEEWIHSWPHGLSYINALWGGTSQGYKLVCDSNYDWGQGLKELKEWQKANARPLTVTYFGLDPGLKNDWSTSLPIQELSRKNPGNYPMVIPGTLAISSTLVFGPPLSPEHSRLITLFRSQSPDSKVGPFLIYQPATLERLSKPTPARVLPNPADL